jgi:hypothetical protein
MYYSTALSAMNLDALESINDKKENICEHNIMKKHYFLYGFEQNAPGFRHTAEAASLWKK